MFSLLISRARALVPTFVARPTIPRREMSQMQRKLHRKTSHRLAMLRNMVTSLIKHERIKTTVAKAKNLKPYAEKLIKWGKRGTHHDKVMAAGIIREQLALRKLFEVLGPRYMV